ncbi:MAG: hypothetical protein BWK80_32480 [Desulfobacteraceae bacterium IS3]|nr:MAG: hypothetical protein BWK80_32480 [Desulfobacteraceae bacterium IS3]
MEEKSEKKDTPETKDKIATIIFRVIILCLGIGLLILMKKNGHNLSMEEMGLFGLFIGYGLGGDKLAKFLKGFFV